MGAWPRMALRLPELLGRPLSVISLPASSAPAAGSAKVHAASHRELIETAIPSDGGLNPDMGDSPPPIAPRAPHTPRTTQG